MRVQSYRSMGWMQERRSPLVQAEVMETLALERCCVTASRRAVLSPLPPPPPAFAPQTQPQLRCALAVAEAAIRGGGRAQTGG